MIQGLIAPSRGAPTTTFRREMTGLVEGARASALTGCQADARAAPQKLEDPRQQDSSAARPNSYAEATRVGTSGGEPPGWALDE